MIHLDVRRLRVIKTLLTSAGGHRDPHNDWLSDREAGQHNPGIYFARHRTNPPVVTGDSGAWVAFYT